MNIEVHYDPGIEVGRDEAWLCLHRNENLFLEPALLSALARDGLRDLSICSYPDSQQIRLRTALADLYAVGPENVYVGNGADGVLADLLTVLRRRYDELCVLDVCFKVYHLLGTRYGYRITTLPGNTFATGRVSTDSIRASLSVIDSPNGITGASVPLQVLQPLFADPRSFCIWDNVYGEFAQDSLPRPLFANLAIVRSFSKFYGLAAMRIGYCIAHADLVSQLLHVKDAFNVNGLAQEMARLALQHHATFRGSADQMIDARTLLMRELSARGFSMHPAQGNFVLATHPAISAARLQTHLLDHQIAIRRFPDPLLVNHVRITIPRPASLARLEQALDETLADTLARMHGAEVPTERS